LWNDAGEATISSLVVVVGTLRPDFAIFLRRPPEDRIAAAKE
jgi:hypothetical protein